MSSGYIIFQTRYNNWRPVTEGGGENDDGDISSLSWPRAVTPIYQSIKPVQRFLVSCYTWSMYLKLHCRLFEQRYCIFPLGQMNHYFPERSSLSSFQTWAGGGGGGGGPQYEKIWPAAAIKKKYGRLRKKCVYCLVLKRMHLFCAVHCWTS
jgi:hypothetical protein